jgi:nucleotide-binding universal stress UspA family protein
MFEHILIAVDGSENSAAAIPTAVELARKFSGDIFVVHAWEHEIGRAGAFPLETPVEANHLVAQIVKQVQEAGVPVRGEAHSVFTGHTARDIVETARAESVDLIVMGSRGLSDVASLMLGSVTHKVAQLSHIPLLIVRPPEEEKRVEPKEEAYLAGAGAFSSLA